jgi:glycosyltransferase involved in cell wall biosynthesis
MKIAIVNNCVPFMYGGAEFLADSLKDKFIEYGHESMVIRIPFQWNPSSRILEHMLACRLLQLENVDKVIALKFPAYYIQHPNKTLWMLHQFRQAYDLWGTQYQNMPNTPEGLSIRDSIINADNKYLREAKKIYTNSKVVTDRLNKFNGINSEVLFPPLMEAEKYSCGDFGDYIFYPSRINHSKRQYLAVESMKYTKSNVKLIIAGSPDTANDLIHIETIVRENNLQSKVKIIGKFISQDEKVDLFAKSLGCIYIPYDEDSYGYVTLESFHSQKPVITCNDSGGTDVVVKNDLTGYVVSPDPQEIAAAMDKLFYDKKLARELGQNGFKHLVSLGITWENVIERLIK